MIIRMSHREDVIYQGLQKKDIKVLGISEKVATFAAKI